MQGIYGTGGGNAGGVAGEVDTLLALVGLDGSLSRRKFRNCSTGMKQRLGIAAALLGDPPLLILDEPTNGLDPAGILEVRQLIRDLRGSGQTPRTIILASHLLYEVEQVCDQVGIMARGRLLYAGPVAEMSAPGAVFLRSTDDRRAETALTAAGWSVSESGNGLEVAAETGDEWQVSRDLAAAGLYISEMRAVGGTLEAGFMAVTGGGAGSPGCANRPHPQRRQPPRPAHRQVMIPAPWRMEGRNELGRAAAVDAALGMVPAGAPPGILGGGRHRAAVHHSGLDRQRPGRRL